MKPTKEQVARAVEVLRKEGIDTAEKFEALLLVAESRQARTITPGMPDDGGFDDRD